MVMNDGRLPEEGGEYGEYPEEDMECDEAYDTLLADYEALAHAAGTLITAASGLQALFLGLYLNGSKAASGIYADHEEIYENLLRSIQIVDGTIDDVMEQHDYTQDEVPPMRWQEHMDKVGAKYDDIEWPAELYPPDDDEEEPE